MKFLIVNLINILFNLIRIQLKTLIIKKKTLFKSSQNLINLIIQNTMSKGSMKWQWDDGSCRDTDTGDHNNARGKNSDFFFLNVLINFT